MFDIQEGMGHRMCAASPMALSNYYDRPEAGSLTGLRVLVVEDSWHLAKAMTRFLKGLGADVAEPVATTAETERAITERRPDVALVDINLRNGELAYDLIDSLRKQAIRVIVITGYEVIPLASSKVEAVLQKPVSGARLIATLRQVTAL